MAAKGGDKVHAQYVAVSRKIRYT